jgi:hypothetical protein
LTQAKKFLPEMARADAQLIEALKVRDRSEFNIENVQGVHKYVEMNVELVKLEESESDTDSENGFDSESTQSSSNCEYERDSDMHIPERKTLLEHQKETVAKSHIKKIELVTKASDK